MKVRVKSVDQTTDRQRMVPAARAIHAAAKDFRRVKAQGVSVIPAMHENYVWILNAFKSVDRTGTLIEYSVLMDPKGHYPLHGHCVARSSSRVKTKWRIHRDGVVDYTEEPITP